MFSTIPRTSSNSFNPHQLPSYPPLTTRPSSFPSQPPLPDLPPLHPPPSQSRRDSLPYVEAFFKDLAQKTKKQFSERVVLQSHQVASRFTDVECPLSTAVKTTLSNGESHYLHANYVTTADGFRYISTQAPIEYNPSNPYQPPTQNLFWKTAFNNNKLIVDLTGSRDGISRYYPDAGQTFEFEDLLVSCQSSRLIGNCISSTFYIQDKATRRTKTITRVHFPYWLDHNGTSPKQLSEIISIMDNFSSEETPLIHCRAGVGRTGTLITARTINNLIIQRKIRSDSDLKSRISQIILSGRRDRGTGFVQRPGQLKAILDFGEFALAKFAAAEKTREAERVARLPSLEKIHENIVKSQKEAFDYLDNSTTPAGAFVLWPYPEIPNSYFFLQKQPGAQASELSPIHINPAFSLEQQVHDALSSDFQIGRLKNNNRIVKSEAEAIAYLENLPVGNYALWPLKLSGSNGAFGLLHKLSSSGPPRSYASMDREILNPYEEIQRWLTSDQYFLVLSPENRARNYQEAVIRFNTSPPSNGFIVWRNSDRAGYTLLKKERGLPIERSHPIHIDHFCDLSASIAHILGQQHTS